MSLQSKLSSLQRRGAAISVIWTGRVEFPAIFRSNERAVFWVNQFPQNQSSAHAVEYDDWNDNGVGVTLRRDGKDVAYIAPFAQWPEVDADQAAEEKSRWDELQQSPTERGFFEDFTKAMAAQLT